MTSCCSLVFQTDSIGAAAADAEDTAIAVAVSCSRRLRHWGKIASGFPHVELEDHFTIDVVVSTDFSLPVQLSAVVTLTHLRNSSLNFVMQVLPFVLSQGLFLSIRPDLASFYLFHRF